MKRAVLTGNAVDLITGKKLVVGFSNSFFINIVSLPQQKQCNVSNSLTNHLIGSFQSTCPYQLCNIQSQSENQRPSKSNTIYCKSQCQFKKRDGSKRVRSREAKFEIHMRRLRSGAEERLGSAPSVRDLFMRPRERQQR